MGGAPCPGEPLCRVSDAVGLRRGGAVSIMMENRIEYLAAIIATNKLGVTAGLINSNLRERPLSHCIAVTESKKCIFGGKVQHAIDQVRGELDLLEDSDYFVIPEAGAAAPPDSPFASFPNSRSSELKCAVSLGSSSSEIEP